MIPFTPLQILTSKIYFSLIRSMYVTVKGKNYYSTDTSVYDSLQIPARVATSQALQKILTQGMLAVVLVLILLSGASALFGAMAFVLIGLYGVLNIQVIPSACDRLAFHASLLHAWVPFGDVIGWNRRWQSLSYRDIMEKVQAQTSKLVESTRIDHDPES